MMDRACMMPYPFDHWLGIASGALSCPSLSESSSSLSSSSSKLPNAKCLVNTTILPVCDLGSFLKNFLQFVVLFWFQIWLTSLQIVHILDKWPQMQSVICFSSSGDKFSVRDASVSYGVGHFRLRSPLCGAWSQFETVYWPAWLSLSTFHPFSSFWSVICLFSLSRACFVLIGVFSEETDNAWGFTQTCMIL